jgi:hypothetical protein
MKIQRQEGKAGQAGRKPGHPPAKTRDERYEAYGTSAAASQPGLRTDLYRQQSAQKITVPLR